MITFLVLHLLAFLQISQVEGLPALQVEVFWALTDFEMFVSVLVNIFATNCHCSVSFKVC